MPKGIAFDKTQVDPGRIGVWVHKRDVVSGEVIFDEPHFHEIRPNESIPDGIAALKTCLELNNWPVTVGEVAQLIVHANNARPNGQEQSPPKGGLNP